MLSACTIGAMASKKASSASPVKPCTALASAGEVNGPVAMMTLFQSFDGRPAISPRSMRTRGSAASRVPTSAENALRSIRPGGTLSSLGVYSGKLIAPYEALYAGLGDQKIVTTLCPGGKERMRRLMAMIEHKRVDLAPLVTHRFALDQIEEAFDLFSTQRDGVLKVALYPDAARALNTVGHATSAAMAESSSLPPAHARRRSGTQAPVLTRSPD